MRIAAETDSDYLKYDDKEIETEKDGYGKTERQRQVATQIDNKKGK